ncbi:MAG: CotH kinase family protein [Bacteroidales bacterium]|nr:CotH kinase family protein [Bacteroidales bacterium]
MMHFFSRAPFATHYVLFFLLLSGAANAQDRFPINGPLFDNSTLARVDITIHPDSLAMILAEGNEQSDHEYMATFTFNRGNYSETIDSIGFRLRGNTSRNSAKKSFKVSLNTFIRGQKFYGVEKINLNGEHNDPSMSRALLSWYLFREAGVPGSRANHVRLYINGAYRGLYLNVEHVDEEFVDLRFGNNNGNLYKCLWPADLVYRGSDPDKYKQGNDGRRAYELKTNVEADDYSDLAHFIGILNNTTPDIFPLEMNRVFNINSYLKYLAVEILAGHWDAYSYNKNNYYLYYNEGTRKFEFIPYDPDNTFGISWFDDDWTTRDIYGWSKHGEPRPLTERILQHQVYRDRFSFYMDRLLDATYSSTHLDPWLDSAREQILGAAADDLYRTLDYGYTYQDFYNSFELAAGAHVRKGIKPFINTRSASALDQLNLNPVDPIITLLYVSQPILTEKAEVQFLVEDDGEISEVKAFFSSGDAFTERPLARLNDGVYRAIHPGLSSDGVVRFYLEATDDEMNTSRDPEEGWYSIYYGVTSASGRIVETAGSVSIYPNPASSFMEVAFNDADRLPVAQPTYHIYDASGRLLIRGRVDDNTGRITLPGEFTNGWYLLELNGQDSTGNVVTRHAKFIISK